MVFAGNRALDSMGFTTFGFAGGRADVWEADETYWGPEDTWCADERHSGVRNLDEPLAGTEMGLIDVTPQGPAAFPDQRGAARAFRPPFCLTGIGVGEVGAVLVGGHTHTRSRHP